MAFTNAQMAQAFGDELDLTPEQVEALEAAFEQWAIGGARLATWTRLATDIGLFNNAAVAMVHDWYGGTATGGPNGDGLYPLMNSEGEVFSVPSPARVAADLTGFEPMGTLTSTDDLPATGSPGDLWIVAGNAWGWNSRLSAWRNLGQFRGATGQSAKEAVIAAGSLPAGSSDADFASWLANAQIAALQPSIDAAAGSALAAGESEEAAATSALAAAGSASATEADAIATAADRLAAEGARGDAEAAASAASSSASEAAGSLGAVEDARDDAADAKAAAEAAASAAAASQGATAADRIATGADRTATAADRVAAASSASTASSAAGTATSAATTATGAAVDVAADLIAVEAARVAAEAAQAAAEQARDDAEAIVGGDFLTEIEADGRYRKLADALGISDITGLTAALASKATPADIAAAIDNLVDGAPAALNTLKELADALEDSEDALAALVLTVGGKQAALGFIPENAANKGVASGYAGLDAAGKIPLTQLPDDLGGGAVDSVAGLTGEITAWALSGALGIRADFGQQAISLARLTGAVQGMARGLADDFQTDTGVDAAASTNEHRTSAHVYVGRTPVAAVANNMTSDTAPSPQIASASSAYSGYPASRAFDNSPTTYWCPETPAAAPTAWLQRRLSAAIVLSSYAIRAPANVSTDGYPIAWTLRGSNNGTTWVNLDQRTAQVFDTGEVKTFAVAVEVAYLYYRLQLSAASQYGAVADLAFSGATVQDLSLRSVAYTATATPSKAMLTVRAKGSSALTPGTDLRGYVSRDGGTTWTEATLVAGITTGGFTTFEAVDISLTSQPSGTSMKWRVDGLGTKAPEIDAVVLQWSAN